MYDGKLSLTTHNIGWREEYFRNLEAEIALLISSNWIDRLTMYLIDMLPYQKNNKEIYFGALIWDHKMKAMLRDAY